jgi:hypothetical protein
MTKLGNTERAALLILMAHEGPVSNPQLRELAGFALDGQARRTLNDLDLVRSAQHGRPYQHQLTEAGWRWCAAELSAERPQRGGPLGSALYVLLAALRDGSADPDRQVPRLKSLFAGASDGAATSAGGRPEHRTADRGDIEEAIRAGYWRLARRANDWISLTDLRPLLEPADRQVVDAALVRLERSGTATLVPEDDQQRLTDRDRASAVRIGGSDLHLIAFESR